MRIFILSVIAVLTFGGIASADTTPMPRDGFPRVHCTVPAQSGVNTRQAHSLARQVNRHGWEMRAKIITQRNTIQQLRAQLKEAQS